ncbi:unnamed protein product, partial [Ectocarpus sp. 8 AP-2014]
GQGRHLWAYKECPGVRSRDIMGRRLEGILVGRQARKDRSRIRKAPTAHDNIPRSTSVLHAECRVLRGIGPVARTRRGAWGRRRVPGGPR